MYHLWWLYFPFSQLRHCIPFWSTIILITNNSDIDGHKRNLYKNIKWKYFMIWLRDYVISIIGQLEFQRYSKNHRTPLTDTCKYFIKYHIPIHWYTLSLMYDKNIHDYNYDYMICADISNRHPKSMFIIKLIKFLIQSFCVLNSKFFVC